MKIVLKEEILGLYLQFSINCVVAENIIPPTKDVLVCMPIFLEISI